MLSFGIITIIMRKQNSYILKNGAELIVREGAPTDATACLAFIEKVSAQSTFLTFGPGEFGLSVEEEEKVITDKNARDNELFLLGTLDNKIVSQLTVNSSQRPRLRHAAEFGISVDASVWGLGVGTVMLQYLMNWANASPIVRKVNLQVLPQNERGIKLYEKFGFKIEGRKLRDNFQDGIYSDVLLMGKLID